MDTDGGNDSLQKGLGVEEENVRIIFASVVLTEMTDICNKQGREWQDAYWRSHQGPDQHIVM